MSLPSAFRVFFLASLFIAQILCDASVTIDQSDIYKNQRVCAFGCFNGFDDIGYPIAQELSCPTFKVYNDCFCRTDLQGDANNYISSCVYNRCSKNAHDLSIATSLYDDYCTSNGYTAEAQITAATGASTITITQAAKTIERTTTATQTVVATTTVVGAAQPVPLNGASLLPAAIIGVSFFARWIAV
jgi:hypothetical protein